MPVILTQLTALIELQKIDQTLLQLKKEAQGIPGRKEALHRKADSARAALEAARQQSKEHESAIRQLDLDASAIRAQVTRYRQQQMEVKSNDTYKTLEHEIQGCAEKINALEDRELELMEGTEALQKQIAKAKAALAEAERLIAEEGAGLDQRLALIREQFESVKARRDPLTAQIEPEIIDRYQNLLAAKDGVAVAPVQSGGCDGCHMKLNPQSLHDAHAAAKWTYCGHCGRILYDPVRV